jgi:hypothetical protein
MHDDDAITAASPDSEYLWLRDGSLPRAREDRIAEAVALAALLFSLGIGVVIATLPVSARAAASAEAALAPSGVHIVAADPARRPRFDAVRD